MENEIKISVIMPIYNAFDYLRPAMDSIMDQTLREIEIICVDDGSTDHSFDIIKEYQKSDERIRIVTQNNAGVAIARNNGIRRARGEYIAFLDADDFLEPTFLENLYTAAKEGDLDIAIGEYDLFRDRAAKFVRAIPSEREDIYSGGRITSKNEHPDEIFQSTDGYAWNKIFRRAFLLDKGIQFLADARMFEDVYFVMTALSLAARVGKAEGVYFHHRIYSDSARNRLFRKYYKQVPVIYAKIKEFLMHNGMFLPLETSFVNLAASRIYKVYNILWRDVKDDFWDMLHTVYAEELGWNAVTPEIFTDSEVGEFIANVAMYTFKQFDKREKKGHKVKMDNFSKSLKTQKKREKIKGFFAKIFKKQK